MDFGGLYRDIVEASPDAIWVFDLEGRTLYANAALARMFGVEHADLRDVTVFDSLDDVGRGQFGAHLRDVAEGRFNSEEVETQFVRRDGSTMWVLINEAPLRGADGSVVGVVHRLSDYSGRRQMVEDLRASQQQLAEAQRIARIGSWEWDIDRDELTTSRGLLELYGLEASVFPATYADFLTIVHEDDRPSVDLAVQRARRDAGEFVFEARIMGASDWVWTRGRGVAQTDESGRVVAMSGTHQDITETKLAELALQDQINQNRLMQAVATAANEARRLEEVLAHGKSLVLLHDDWERGRGFVVTEDGRHLEPFYVSREDREADEREPDRAARELALAGRAWRERASVWDEARLTIACPVTYGGEVFAVFAITSAPPLLRHDLIQENVEQVAVQLARVVEREQAERALAAARDAAMEASRKKSEFLATMSHEIRTPLNGVIGLNDLLLRTRLDADQQRLASGVQVASRGLLGLINDILDFSKIEAGKLELEHVDFDVRSVFDQVANVLGESARAKGLELIMSCDQGVPGILTGDPTRLAQVVTNLGSNAVKFTEDGEICIRATGDVRDGGTLLRVEVTDTGIGIDLAEIEELFETFTQADTSTTRVHGGTGLGLAISREIVHALGGEIGVDSESGHGSVFWFTALFGAPEVPEVSDADREARSALAQRRALVVDANDRHCEVLAAHLSWWGMRSRCVGSPAEAEAALASALDEQDPIAVVLFDQTLVAADPDRELVGAVRANPAYDQVTLLMLTSSTDLDTATIRRQGVADYVTKPVLAHALRTALMQHLAGVEAPVSRGPAHRAGTGERPRILVVEDNQVNQMVAVGLLDALGYESDTADDGLAALEALEVGTYDAVLMDVQMPRLDGYAATRAIREREGPGHRVPVLAMTAAAVEGERERCLAAGMDAFLTKPVDPDALAASLTQWLGDRAPGRRRGAKRVPEAPPPVPGLDVARLDELRDLAPGDTSYLDRAIGNFVATAPGHLETVRVAVAQDDCDALREAAHRLSGSASNLGVQEVGSLARELELLAAHGTTDGAEPLLARLSEELELGQATLLGYQSSYRDRAAPVGSAHEG